MAPSDTSMGCSAVLGMSEKENQCEAASSRPDRPVQGRTAMKRPEGLKLGGLRASQIPRGRWLNAILGVVLVAVIAAAYFTVNSSGKTATVAARTSTVYQGS